MISVDLISSLDMIRPDLPALIMRRFRYGHEVVAEVVALGVEGGFSAYRIIPGVIPSSLGDRVTFTEILCVLWNVLRTVVRWSFWSWALFT